MPGDNSALGRRALAALILAGAERDDTRLPTERQLALDLGVSRAAVRHAMAVLQAEGRVSREVGRGTFLRRGPGAAGPEPEPAGERAADERALGEGVLAADEPPDAAGEPADAAGEPPGPGGLSGAADYAPADVMAVRRLFEPTAMSLVAAGATTAMRNHLARVSRHLLGTG